MWGGRRRPSCDARRRIGADRVGFVSRNDGERQQASCGIRRHSIGVRFDFRAQEFGCARRAECADIGRC